MLFAFFFGKKKEREIYSILTRVFFGVFLAFFPQFCFFGNERNK
jgi:hypothetical protein